MKIPSKPSQLPTKQTRKLWKQLQKEKEQEERLAKTDGESFSAPRKSPKTATPEDATLAESWNALKAEAKIRFPEHLSDKFDLEPVKKTVAMAHMIGWSQNQIAKAAGLNQSTINRYLKELPVREFMEAFEYYRGTKDGKDMLKREIYPSIQVLKEIRDDSSAPASVRRDISQWFFEQLHGKAKETREIKGQSIKSLTQELMRLKEDDFDDEDLN